MAWDFSTEPEFQAQLDWIDGFVRDELTQRYASRSGLPVDEIDYYIVLARFKMACVLEGGYARYVKGGADNPRMELFGEVVLDMARRAAELARRA